MKIEKKFSNHFHVSAINSLTVIGNGMLAKGFFKYVGIDLPVCVFASGVSDSNCILDSEFQRESTLLDEVCAQLPSRITLVYFSSTLEEVSFKQYKYFMHKRQMEDKVRKRSRHLIIRVGQLVGHSANPNTLTNFLYAKIFQRESFHMWHGQSRNLLDLDDVVEATIEQLKNCKRGTVVLANPVSYDIKEIVQAFEILLKRKALAIKIKISGIKNNSKEEVSIQYVSPCIDANGYLKRVLEKYYEQKIPTNLF